MSIAVILIEHDHEYFRCGSRQITDVSVMFRGRPLLCPLHFEEHCGYFRCISRGIMDIAATFRGRSSWNPSWPPLLCTYLGTTE